MNRTTTLRTDGAEQDLLAVVPANGVLHGHRLIASETVRLIRSQAPARPPLPHGVGPRRELPTVDPEMSLRIAPVRQAFVDPPLKGARGDS